MPEATRDVPMIGIAREIAADCETLSHKIYNYLGDDFNVDSLPVHTMLKQLGGTLRKRANEWEEKASRGAL